MGVDGLWEMLKPARQTVTLLDLSITEGLDRRKLFRIGVDADSLMSQCVAGARSASAGVHGLCPLSVLFYKLCKFLRSPGTLIFVFDGPNRPEKRGKKFNGYGHAPSWHGPCQSLVKAFGFHIHMAPGESEAELAKLNQIGAIDAILTTDSDAVVFGAQRVLRSMTVKESRKFDLHAEEISQYTAHGIETTTGVSLTPGGLLLTALVLVGDYSPGLTGCGRSTALALARCGFGDSLLNAVQSLDWEEFEGFRRKWLENLKNELTNNTLGFLSSRLPNLAANIPDTFPESSILELYLLPLTSFSLPQIPPDTESWKERKQPQIQLITSFCQTNLGWTNSDKLLKTFQSNLWEGIFLQLLFMDGVEFDPKSSAIFTPHLQISIKILRSQRKERHILHAPGLAPWNRITFSTKPLVEALGDRIPLFSTNTESKKYATCTVWAPSRILPVNMVSVPMEAALVKARCTRGMSDSVPGPTKMRVEIIKNLKDSEKEFFDLNSPLPPPTPIRLKRASYQTQKQSTNSSLILSPPTKHAGPERLWEKIDPTSRPPPPTFAQLKRADQNPEWSTNCEVIDVYPSPPPTKRARPGELLAEIDLTSPSPPPTFTMPKKLFWNPEWSTNSEVIDVYPSPPPTKRMRTIEPCEVQLETMDLSQGSHDNFPSLQFYWTGAGTVGDPIMVASDLDDDGGN